MRPPEPIPAAALQSREKISRSGSRKARRKDEDEARVEPYVNARCRHDHERARRKKSVKRQKKR